MMTFNADFSGRARALAFCRNSKSAVIATTWPTAHSCVDDVRTWLTSSGAELLFDTSVYMKPEAAVPAILALYHGERWLESNCWYMESPLPEGPPNKPFAGAKWKSALAFREDAPMHVFVVDSSSTQLWSGKYSIREKLRQQVGSLGNSCLHLTDDQSGALEKWRSGNGVLHGGGYECDSSYAFHCARVLLNQKSVEFLNSPATTDEISFPIFRSRFELYTNWLSDATFQDISENGLSFRDLPFSF